MENLTLSKSRPKIQQESDLYPQDEILIYDIINDEDNYNHTVLSITNTNSTKNKIIPTNYDNQLNNRNSPDRGSTTWLWLRRLFGRTQQNRLTLREAMEMRQRELLNDYAYETQKKNCWSKITKKLSKSIIVFDPASLIYIIWQVFNCLTVMFFFYQIPFMLCFEELIRRRIEDGNAKSAIFDIQYGILYGAMVVFTLDILISLNTAFYDKGQLVYSRKSILSRYTRKYLLLDVIPIICLVDQLLILGNDNKFIGYFQLLFILKIYEIQKTVDIITDYIQLRKTTLAYFRLLEVMLTIMWLCHIFACLFHRVGFEYSEYRMKDNNLTVYERSWINSIDLFQQAECDDIGRCFRSQTYNDSSIKEIYTYSFYWAVTTMASVGYGDITPKNSHEVWITTMSEFISCIVFAYSINAIWEVINQSKESKQKFQKYVNAMERFMFEHNVNRKLKTKVDAYLYHLYQTEKQRDSDIESTLFQKLAPGLRQELLYDTFGKVFQSRVFFKNFEVDLLKELANDIEQVTYCQGEVVFLQGDEVDDFPIYYIENGLVEIYLHTEKGDGIKLNTLHSNQSFGLMGFVTGVERSASAKCLTYSRMYRLSRQKFLKRLEEFPEDKETFFRIRHEVLFGENLQSINLRCYICESNKHTAAKCDKTIYIPDKQALIMQSQNEKNHRNRGFQRKNKKPYQALQGIREYQAYAHVVRRTNLSMTFDDDSSEEDNEVSSDVDEYEEELLDIQKLVDEEKLRAQLKKENLWLEDDKYEMKIDEEQQSLDTSQDLNKLSQELLQKRSLLIPRANSDEDSLNHKKMQKKVPKKAIKNIRTSSMVTIQEKKKLKIAKPSNIRPRKMTTESPLELQQANINLSPQQQIISSPFDKQHSLLRKLKIIKQQQPQNQVLNDILDDLKGIIPQRTHSNQCNSNDIEEQQQNSNIKQEDKKNDDVESDFSIDQMQNYQNFFQQENPAKVIKKVKKELKRYRRTTMFLN